MFRKRFGICSNDFRREMANPQTSMLEVNSPENTVNPTESRVNSPESTVNPTESRVNVPESCTQNRVLKESCTQNRVLKESCAQNGGPLSRCPMRKKFDRTASASFSRSGPAKTTEGGAFRILNLLHCVFFYIKLRAVNSARIVKALLF